MSAVPEPTAGRLPDFFIVGHQKCGTTALYLMLGRHPQIFMPEVKEPKYFATDLRSRFGVQLESARRLHTLEGYQELFEGAEPGQLVGEASPQYLRSKAAPGAIAALVPDARIIAILREPAAFLRSFHMQMVSSKVETETDFRKALALEPERREGRRIPPASHHPEALLYSEHVRYVEQLRRFHDLFGRERVLVLIYDDFRADNDATVRGVLRFLDVDDTIPVQTQDTKPLKEVRSHKLHQLAGARRLASKNPAAASPLGRALNRLTPAAMRGERFRSLWRSVVYRQPAPPDPEFMRELRRGLGPEVRALSDYLGRDLVTLWGYGE